MRGLTIKDAALLGHGVSTPAAPTFVQSAGNAATAGVGATATATATFSAATAGNLLVAGSQGFASGQTATSTFPTPAGWTEAVVLSPGTTIAIVRIFYKIAAGGETSLSVTEVASNTAEVQVEVVEFSGATTWTLDKTNTNDAASGTSSATGSTGVLSSAVGISFAAIAMPTSVSAESWNSSFNSVSHTTDKLLAAYLINSATTALNPTGSWTTSADPVAAIATFTAV